MSDVRYQMPENQLTSVICHLSSGAKRRTAQQQRPLAGEVAHLGGAERLLLDHQHQVPRESGGWRESGFVWRGAHRDVAQPRAEGVGSATRARRVPRPATGSHMGRFFLGQSSPSLPRDPASTPGLRVTGPTKMTGRRGLPLYGRFDFA